MRRVALVAAVGFGMAGIPARAEFVQRRLLTTYEASVASIERVAGGKLEIERCARLTGGDPQRCKFKEFDIDGKAVSVAIVGEPGENIHAIDVEMASGRSSGVRRSAAGSAAELIDVVVEIATGDARDADDLRRYIDDSLNSRHVGPFPESLMVIINKGRSAKSIYIRARGMFK